MYYIVLGEFAGLFYSPENWESFNVFYGSFWVTFIRLSIDIETVFVIPVTAWLNPFERRADFGVHFIEQGSAESIAEIGIVEVSGIAPETIIAVTTLRNKAVYMGVPF